MENQVTQTKTALTAKSLFARDDVKSKFQEMLGKRSASFITSVLQIVSSNNLLKDADPNSIYQAAAVAATLDLPLNNNLGFAYIIPYNQRYKDEQGNWKSKQVAQFQMGYKGFIQLAQRSGQFKTISVTPIYEGQLIEQNPLTGFVFDFTKKTSETVIGYASYFSLINGFEKMFYMTREEVQRHGSKYSKTYNNANGLWNTDFDSMSCKTVLKLLLSKYAPLSVEMQRAVVSDQAVINNAETSDITYVDAIEPAQLMSQEEKEEERILLMIEDAKVPADLELIFPHLISDAHNAAYKSKLNQLLDASI